MEHTKLNDIRNEIRHSFHFLFERGFEISRARFHNGAAWAVILSSAAFNFHVTSDRLEISVAVTDHEDKIRFELFEIVYLVSNKKEFIGPYEDQGEYKDAANYRAEQFQRLALLLHTYLDEITAFFTVDPAQNFEGLQSVRVEVRELHSKALNEKLSRMNLL